MPKISYQLGFPEEERAAAGRMYEDAFGKKFAVAIPDQDLRVKFLESSMRPTLCFAAFVDGELAGIAGIHTAEKGAFVDSTARAIVAQLGLIRSIRAILIFALYERKPAAEEMFFDGIAVRADMRGKGIGSGLLDAVATHARQAGFSSVVLDVIDTNPAAKRLYQRKGFTPEKTETFPYLKWLIGFSASTRMRMPL